jgi:hypothetical protein
LSSNSSMTSLQKEVIHCKHTAGICLFDIFISLLVFLSSSSPLLGVRDLGGEQYGAFTQWSSPFKWQVRSIERWECLTRTVHSVKKGLFSLDLSSGIEYLQKLILSLIPTQILLSEATKQTLLWPALSFHSSWPWFWYMEGTTSLWNGNCMNSFHAHCSSPAPTPFMQRHSDAGETEWHYYLW